MLWEAIKNVFSYSGFSTKSHVMPLCARFMSQCVFLNVLTVFDGMIK